jgi:hypothetical protein
VVELGGGKLRGCAVSRIARASVAKLPARSIASGSAGSWKAAK